MNLVKKSLEAAYSQQVTEIYSVFERSILIADGDISDIQAAETKFKLALIHANHVLAKALTITNEI